MADPKLIEYIKECLTRGSSAEEIRLSLLETGWPEDQINAGMAEATVMRPPAPEPQRKEENQAPKKGSKKIIVLLIVLFMLVIMLLYAALSILGIFNSMFPTGMESVNNLLGGGGNT
jgi:hypothetical protein